MAEPGPPANDVNCATDPAAAETPVSSLTSPAHTGIGGGGGLSRSLPQTVDPARLLTESLLYAGQLDAGRGEEVCVWGGDRSCDLVWPREISLFSAYLLTMY